MEDINEIISTIRGSQLDGEVIILQGEIPKPTVFGTEASELKEGNSSHIAQQLHDLADVKNKSREAEPIGQPYHTI